MFAIKDAPRVTLVPRETWFEIPGKTICCCVRVHDTAVSVETTTGTSVPTSPPRAITRAAGGFSAGE